MTITRLYKEEACLSSSSSGNLAAANVAAVNAAAANAAAAAAAVPTQPTDTLFACRPS